MKILLIGVAHVKGTGKNGPYDFCLIRYAVPLETVMTESRQVHGYVCEVKELPLDPHAIGQFKDCIFGEEIDIEVSPNPRNLSRNMCVGLKP